MPKSALNPALGLSAKTAAQRLKSDGPNLLPQAQRRGFFRLLLEVLREPMLALLLVGSAVYLALGSVVEAVALGVFASLSIGITLGQAARSDRVLAALRDLTSPRAQVLRGGAALTIPAQDLVRGDVIVLAAGSRVPADAALLVGADLRADESLLTGESAPVHRAFGAAMAQVFAGTLVIAGAGQACVTATGARSEIGKIGASLAALSLDAPRLQVQMQRLVLWFGLVGGAVSLAVVLL